MIKTENKLDYSETRDFSLATSSRYYKANAPHTEYKDNEIIEVKLDLNKNDYVDGSKSYIQFVFNGFRSAGGLFELGDQGSMLSVFKTIQLIGKDGQTIDTYDNVAQFATTQLLCHPDKAYKETVGLNFAYNNVPIPSGDHVFNIPMPVIMPLFKCANLLPPEILNGMRIRFTLYDAATIVVAPLTGFESQSITISKFQAVFNTYRMDDIALKQLATDSKQVEYTSYIHKEKYFTTVDGSAYINISINHELERATRAFAIAIPKPATLFDRYEESAIFDSEEDPIDHSDVRWRIGQMYTEPVNDVMEQVMRLQHAFNSYNVSLLGYKAIHAIDLTRSVVQKGSTPLDNSNNLTIEFKKVTDRNQDVHLYVEYQKTIKF